MMREEESPLPLATQHPIISTAGDEGRPTKTRRHLGQGLVAEEGNDTAHDDPCSPVLKPDHVLACSPALADLDGDGRMEVVYVALWQRVTRATMTDLGRLDIVAFTLQQRFEEVYGEGAIDFGRFLPVEEQPWTQFMGTGRDAVYRSYE